MDSIVNCGYAVKGLSAVNKGFLQNMISKKSSVMHFLNIIAYDRCHVGL